MYHAVGLGVAILVALSLVTEAQVPSQGVRAFADVCENCIVSRGHGFSSFDGDCNCFYICDFVGTYKLSSMTGVSPWIGYKRCCGCGASFSRLQLACVNFRSKKSDCFFGNSEGTNPCTGKMMGEKIPREDPNQVDGELCSGFIECVPILNGTGTILVPEQKCCPDDQCFSESNDMCTHANCDDSTNALCNMKLKTDDCDCELPIAEEKECPFMVDPDDPTVFMGIEQMDNYTCPLGTCFDEEICACVQTNNTRFTDCVQYLTADFEDTGPVNTTVITTDGRGATVWNKNEFGSLDGSSYVSEEKRAFLNVIGTAYNEPGNNFVFRISFTLIDDEEESDDQKQCMVGNCLRAETTAEPPETDTIRVTVWRNGTEDESDGTDVELSFVYQDKYSMVGLTHEFSSTANLNLLDDYEVGTVYTLWAIYCGDHGEEMVGAAIYSGEGENEADLLTTDTEAVPNSQKIMVGQSGFMFGRCGAFNGFEGSFQSIDFYKCKLDGDDEYDAVFQDIFGVSGG